MEFYSGTYKKWQQQVKVKNIMKIDYADKDIFNPTLMKLASLIERYYGCKLEYQSITRLLIDSPEIAFLESSLQEGQTVSAGDLAFLPIFKNNSLAGAARISNYEKLSDKQMKLLSQTVRVIIESRLENVDRLDFLENFETQAKENLDEKSSRTSNVIPLNRFKANRFPLPERNPALSNQLNFSFLIEGTQSEEIFKMAFEIHTRSQRYAFLPIEDLNASVFESPTQLKEMGHLTIYIENIASLSAARQQQILDFYKSERDKECPQFIVATTTPISELKKSANINQELLSRLSVGYLCMTQPFATYKKENLLDFFYDSLTGRTSV
jgi:hypothetical protein